MPVAEYTRFSGRNLWGQVIGDKDETIKHDLAIVTALEVELTIVSDRVFVLNDSVFTVEC